ncbi:MAG: NAD(P)H-dependent oxidoreductase [Candidatus Eisenbacteria bacterium]|nr:NAD(P)H-dependent oxidoreductase [Candidatus Eisenbacteria bacterium]
MRITILNGNPDPSHRAFDEYVGHLGVAWQNRGHEVRVLGLRDINLASCVGCFDCWLKTPGRCIARDSHPDLIRAYLDAHLVVAASPLCMGFTSAVLKKATDKLIPVLLPYIDGSSGECRHYLRYGRAPALGVLFEPETDTDAEDVEIVATLWRRFTRNANTRLSFVRSTSDPIEEVTREVDSL